MTLYLGLMSGTSMDGIDAALLQIEADGMQLRQALTHEWPSALQSRLRRAAEQPEHTHLAEYGSLESAVGLEFAQAVQALLRAAALPPAAVRAIGSHGQTLLHQPRNDPAFTLQVGDPNIIAELSGIDVVADFRRRDLAAGGEGAPLMPAFHAAAFAVAGQPQAVVNIGGIANVTLLGADGSVLGFDTGPGNCLLDAWNRRHRGQPHDAAGRWAASATVHEALLAQLLQHPYFGRPTPKSTGRETFSDAWLEHELVGKQIAPADVQATLSELTARSIAQAVTRAAERKPERILVCGGGAFNTDLLSRLKRALPGAQLATTASCGIAPDFVEAAGFAWLAYRYLSGLAGNLPAVTGARHAVPLGALYRARLP